MNWSVCRSLILAGGILAGCTPAVRTVTLADGTKVPAAPTYISAQEMAAKGKNPYGVPATSFVFYPAKYVPAETSATGIAKKQWEELSGPGGSRFRPANMPDWDRSNADPLDVHHDCFSVERLYVVPWGSGDGEVGMYPANTEPRGLAGYRWLPKIAFDRETGNMWIWDSVSRKTFVFGQDGALVRSGAAENSGAVAEVLGTSEVLTGGPLGKDECRTYLPTSNLNFHGNGVDEEGRFAADESLFSSTTGRLLLDPPNGADFKGRHFVALYTASGIEVFRYTKVK